MNIDQNIIDILISRDGQPTVVHLADKRVLKIWNIAWGYDIGDDFAHITTNISPEIKNSNIYYFNINEIQKIEDQTNGKTLYDREKNGL